MVKTNLTLTVLLMVLLIYCKRNCDLKNFCELYIGMNSRKSLSFN